MVFGFTFGKSKKAVKLIQKYVKERVKKNQLINSQRERLDAQLQNKTIDKDTYKRLRNVLEIYSIKQREEALEKTFQKNRIIHCNPH
jgi:hypothetical protein